MTSTCSRRAAGVAIAAGELGDLVVGSQKQKITRFRIFVCLVGATKLAIKGVPDFQPSVALANKMFDYLDRQMVVGEYNLPRCTPRKSLKRENNLMTMCIMKAVSDVFIFKQVTATAAVSPKFTPTSRDLPATPRSLRGRYEGYPNRANSLIKLIL